MDCIGEASMTTTATKKTRKTRRDTKLNPDMIATIERCLNLGMTQADTGKITGINHGTVAAVKLVLEALGRL
jgi:hypothetical protein